MNRRSACLCLAAAVKASLITSLVFAAEEAAKAVSRIAGPRWNVNGDWTPTAEEIEKHLRDAHGIDPAGLGLEEMLTLHDNDHNRMGYRPGHGHKQRSDKPARGYRKA